MGIKRKSSATYIADTGKEFEVEDMADSHLLNTICHHLKQMEALQKCEQYVTPPHYLIKRHDRLIQTVEALVNELARRDPDTEEERRGENINKKWEYRND